MELFTIGYEKRDLEEFVGLLVEHKVEVLADVRKNAISRKKGFSKTALRNAVEAAGIKYEHFRELGNPSELRKSSKTVDECLEAYSNYMSDKWDDTIGGLLGVATQSKACLMCYELDPAECHRTVVAHEVVRRTKCQLVEI